MGPNDMSLQEIITSIVFGIIWIGTIASIIWWALDPCAFNGHEKPKLRMLNPTCWRCGKPIKEDQ